jgi:hypothetical protein
VIGALPPDTLVAVTSGKTVHWLDGLRQWNPWPCVIN